MGKEIEVQILISDDHEPHHRDLVLNGILNLPEQQENNHKKGIVVFAHGSGSGRYSPRNSILHRS
jgi:hypothetical protein